MARKKLRTSHKLLFVYVCLVAIVVAGFIHIEMLNRQICENQNEVGQVLTDIIDGALVNPDRSTIQDPELREYLEGAAEQREQFGRETAEQLQTLRCP